MHPVSAGFSLYELLIALLLVTALAVIAVPSFAGIVAAGRVRAEIDTLFHAMHLARKESIIRRSVIAICPSANSRDCSAGLDWSSGWIMFSNLDRDEPPQIDPGEPILQVHRSGPHTRIVANRRGFTLRATEKRATNGTLIVCDQRSRVTPRALVISYTGRPRVALENSRGDAYACTN